MIHDTLIWLCCTLPFTLMFLFGPLLVSNWTGTIFVGRQIPNILNCFVLQLVLICFQMYILIALLLNGALMLVVVTSYLFYAANVLLKELTCGLRSYRAWNRIRKVPNIFNVYRGLQIIHIECLSALGPMLVFWHGACTYTPVYANLVLICNWSDVHVSVRILLLVVSVGASFMWLLILQLGNRFCNHGKSLLHSWRLHDWKSVANNREMRKFRKSCRLLLLCFNNTYVIRRITPFLYVKGIVRGTFRALLALK